MHSPVLGYYHPSTFTSAVLLGQVLSVAGTFSEVCLVSCNLLYMHIQNAYIIEIIHRDYSPQCYSSLELSGTSFPGKIVHPIQFVVHPLQFYSMSTLIQYSTLVMCLWDVHSIYAIHLLQLCNTSTLVMQYVHPSYHIEDVLSSFVVRPLQLRSTYTLVLWYVHSSYVVCPVWFFGYVYYTTSFLYFVTSVQRRWVHPGSR